MRITDGMSDSYSSLINELPTGMYYYLFEQDDVKDLGEIIGNNNAVHSVYFAPFFPKGDDTHITIVPYDGDRFGGHWYGNIKRVGDFVTNDTILETDIDIKANIKEGDRHHSQESRLFYEPYTTYLFDDGINPPWELETSQLINKKLSFLSDFMVTDGGYYRLYLHGYKGDYEGRYECLENTANLEIPCGSSAYVTWSSTQKAQSNQTFLNNLNLLSNNTNNTAEQIALNQRHNAIGTVLQAGQNIAGGFLAPIQGDNPVTMTASAIGNVANGFINGGMSVANGLMQNSQLNLQSTINNRNFETTQRAILGSKSALQKDLSNTPRSMMNTNSDILGVMSTGKALRSTLREYTITEEYKKRLGDYFAQFGYKQNKMLSLDYVITSRKYYNYVKTVGANITSNPNGVQIPKDHLNRLQDIFNEGVTIWHLHRNGGKFQDYSMNNVEVNLW